MASQDGAGQHVDGVAPAEYSGPTEANALATLLGQWDGVSPVWIWGYGSLTWKVNFKHVDSLVGAVRGYGRYFYQSSEDHRGVPGKPGRVVTLVEEPGAEVWGVAYKVAPHDVREVLGYLDYREKGGYSAQFVDVFDTAGSSTRALLYTGTEDNEFFVGPAALDAMARQIHEASGPSGPNREYLFHLADAMRKLAPAVHDKHLFELEAAVKALMAAGSDY